MTKKIEAASANGTRRGRSFSTALVACKRQYFGHSLFPEFLRNGDPAPDAEGLGGDLEPRRHLAPFVLVLVHFSQDFPNQFRVEAGLDDLGSRLVLLDIKAEDAVQEVVGGQGILVG